MPSIFRWSENQLACFRGCCLSLIGSSKSPWTYPRGRQLGEAKESVESTGEEWQRCSLLRVPEAPLRRRVRTQLCISLVSEGNRSFCSSWTAFSKHLQTPSLILTTLHVKMESTRPGADGAEWKWCLNKPLVPWPRKQHNRSKIGREWALLFGRWVLSDSFVTPVTVAHQAPLSTGFPRQEYWSGLPFPPPGDLPNPGIEPASPALTGRFFTTEAPGNPNRMSYWANNKDLWGPAKSSSEAVGGQENRQHGSLSHSPSGQDLCIGGVNEVIELPRTARVPQQARQLVEGQACQLSDVLHVVHQGAAVFGVYPWHF